MTLTIRTFAEQEWAIYKDLRLAALAESPDAFGSTFAKEVQRPDAEWATRLASGVNSPWEFPIVAELNGQPIGLAWGRIEEASPRWPIFIRSGSIPTLGVMEPDKCYWKPLRPGR